MPTTTTTQSQLNRDHLIAFRASVEEREEINRAARRDGISAAAFMRRAIFGAVTHLYSEQGAPATWR